MGKTVRFACGAASVVTFVIGVLLIIAGLVVVLKVVPDQTKKTIKEQKQLIKYKNGTYNDYTKDWANPKYISRIQYWVYDYKNPISIINRGQLPDMDEKGPYTYVETTTNDIDGMQDDDRMLTYTQHIKYVFDPTQSCLGCDPLVDKVLVPDVSYFVAMQTLTELPLGALCQQLFPTLPCELIEEEYETVILSLIDDALAAFKAGPFIEVTIDKLLISGYEPPFYTRFIQNVADFICLLLLTPPSQCVVSSPQNVSYGQTLNYTSPHYTILTGKGDYQRVGFIQSFTMENQYNESQPWITNGTLLPAAWWSDCGGDIQASLHARTIRGNTGDFFPSFLKTTDVVPIYVDSICRSIDMTYQKKCTYEGIDCYRFELPATEFNWGPRENCGFCFPLQYDFYDKNAGDACYPDGIMDLSGCQDGAPIAISKPHFYQASDIVRNFVPRLRSKASEDDNIIMDVEPQTGTILMAHKRMQINVMANQFPNISTMSVFMPGAYPIYWLNESFYADQGTVHDIKSDLINQVKLYKIICYSVVGLGGLLMLLSLLSMFGVIYAQRHKDD
ncbi:unnamed protein product, partial [Mesorhabditis spiculigera]